MLPPLFPLFVPLIGLAETPKDAIDAFIRGFNTRQANVMARRVLEGERGYFPSKLALGTIRVVYGPTRIQGDRAQVALTATMTVEGRKTLPAPEKIDLRRVGGQWKIVPKNGLIRENKTRYLGVIAFAVIDPESIGPGPKIEKRETCLSNIKHLAVATLYRAQDDDDTLPKDVSRWKAAITPYLKGGSFRCPYDKPGAVSYFFEPRLAGVPEVSIAHLSETAMVVEGKAGQPVFRHGGRCMVAFADGHVRMVDPETLSRARTIPLR